MLALGSIGGRDLTPGPWPLAGVTGAAGPALMPTPPADKDVGSCPSSQIFLYNLTTCQQTCRSLSEANSHCLKGFAPLDGCGCPDHTFQDEKGRCVTLAKCSCYHRGLYLEAGEVVLRQEERWWVPGAGVTGWQGRLHLGEPIPHPAPEPPGPKGPVHLPPLPLSVCRNGRLHCTQVKLISQSECGCHPPALGPPCLSKPPPQLQLS